MKRVTRLNMMYYGIMGRILSKADGHREPTKPSSFLFFTFSSSSFKLLFGGKSLSGMVSPDFLKGFWD